MAQYPLGIIIRQRRDMLGLSQQQLCQGICDRSTLSRIERGDQVPAYSTLRALLQRLGLQEKDVHFLLGQPDFETAQLQREIVALNTRKQWLQAQQKIRQLQALPTAADPLTRQFILRAKALAGYEQDGKAVPYPYEEQRQMLLEALQISCPGIDPEHLQGHLLGEEEGKLLNQIAITYSESGERRRAIEIYRPAATCRLQLFPPAGPGAPLRGVHRGGGDRAAVLCLPKSLRIVRRATFKYCL